jgi:hypothetical protein
MTRRVKFVFAGCVVAHAMLSWFSMAWCAGVSMAILDSGGTEAPPSLITICWIERICNLPLAPVKQSIFRKLAGYGPPEYTLTYWVLALINSFLAVAIIFFVVHALRKLLRSRHARLAHEET